MLVKLSKAAPVFGGDSQGCKDDPQAKSGYLPACRTFEGLEAPPLSLMQWYYSISMQQASCKTKFENVSWP